MGLAADRLMRDASFVAATEAYRAELLQHCYRMVGSGADAEDLVQETYMRAWRGWAGFQGRSSVRVWLLPATRSILQRARAKLSEAPVDERDVLEPTEPEARALLDGYITAFEQADIRSLERVLRDDATLEGTKSKTWFSGKRTCLEFIGRPLHRPGAWRLIPTTANGQPAAAAYWHGTPYAIVVLTIARDGITAMTVFTDAALFPRFGLPASAPPQPG